MHFLLEIILKRNYYSCMIQSNTFEHTFGNSFLGGAILAEKSIGDYLLRVMRDKNLSMMDVERRAKKLGLPLKQSDLSKIISGTVENPGVFKVVAIARALGVPVIEVVNHITGAKEVDLDARKKAFFEARDMLPPKDRKEIDLMIEMIEREMIRRSLNAQETDDTSALDELEGAHRKKKSRA